jgi:hypothetical protein
LGTLGAGSLRVLFSKPERRSVLCTDDAATKKLMN